MSDWSRLPQLKKRLNKRWESGVFLRELVPLDGKAAGATESLFPLDSKAVEATESLFPLIVALRRPSSSEIMQQFPAVQDWVRELQKQEQRGNIRLEWKTVQHRQLGRNELPAALVFPEIDDLAIFLGQQQDLRLFRGLAARLCERLPELAEWVCRSPFALLKLANDLDRLIATAEWLRENPRPGIYLRELSLPGVDTKFIELHRGVLGQWLDRLLESSAIESSARGVREFARRYGFRSWPPLVRFRILDDALLPAVGGWSDLSVQAAEFQQMELSLKRVFICENDVSALAFPAVPGAIVLFGRGYDFSSLAGAQWLREIELWYWGDIDSHGFEILNQFRTLFPHTRSLLMDRNTLLKHREHWGHEPSPTRAELPGLTSSEQALYRDICSNNLGDNLRLEQEFIPWEYVIRAVRNVDPEAAHLLDAAFPDF